MNICLIATEFKEFLANCLLMVHLNMMKNQVFIWTGIRDGHHLGSSGQYSLRMPDLSTIFGSEPAKSPPNGHSQGVCIPNSHQMRLSVIDPEEMSYLRGLRRSGPRGIYSYFLLRAFGRSNPGRTRIEVMFKKTHPGISLPLHLPTHLKGFLTVTPSLWKQSQESLLR